MPERNPVELIRLTDQEQSVVVRVLDGERFGDQEEYDALQSEIIVTSGFVNGQLDLYLSSFDLENWAEALESLGSGQDISWLESGRSPRIAITPQGESGCVEITVYDVTASQILVTVPIAASSEWVAEHRDRLTDVQRRFPLI